jgi:hypothetical protein
MTMEENRKGREEGRGGEKDRERREKMERSSTPAGPDAPLPPLPPGFLSFPEKCSVHLGCSFNLLQSS